MDRQEHWMFVALPTAKDRQNVLKVKQACIYTTEDTLVCDEIHIHTNCSMNLFWIASLPIEVLSTKSVLRFKPETSDSKEKMIPLHKRV